MENELMDNNLLYRTYTDGQLIGKQKMASSHIGFSLTTNCPLRCRHCIMDASPDRASNTLSAKDAAHFADQMGSLYSAGIRSISLTGGEPFTCKDQLKTISDSALDAGMDSGVVTSGYWAKSKDSVQEMVDRFPGISTWDLSVDVYHQEFVSIDSIKNAYMVIKQNGLRATIRFAVHGPLEGKDLDLHKQILSFSDKEDIDYQKIKKVGRGTNIITSDGGPDNPLGFPCMSSGMMVNYDGRISPCCSNLGAVNNHPFDFGNAREEPLVEIVTNYRTNPLFNLIRATGFSDLLRWIRDGGEKTDRFLRVGDTCDMCQAIFSNKARANMLLSKAAENADKIAILADKILDEKYLLQRYPLDMKISQ